MNINIPDKISKLFVLIGVILIGYSFYDNDNSEKNYFTKIDKLNELKDSSAVCGLISKEKMENIKLVSENLSIKYDVKDPIVENGDSTITFRRTLVGNEQQILVSDSINKLWEKYKYFKFREKLMDEKITRYSAVLKDEKALNKSYHDANGVLQKAGFILFFIGLFIWVIDSPDGEKDILVNLQDKLYSNCQSCGKKFTSSRKYGKEIDSSNNLAFCEDCYNEGKFTNSELTKEEFIEKANEEIKNKNWLAKWILKNRFKNLERWNRNQY